MMRPMKQLGRIRVSSCSFFELTLKVHRFEEGKPRFVIRMPLFKLSTMICGGLLTSFVGRILDIDRKCIGLITRVAPCKPDNMNCIPTWHIEFPLSASPLDKLALTMASVVID